MKTLLICMLSIPFTAIAQVSPTLDTLTITEPMLNTLKQLSKRGLQKQVAKDKSSLDTFEIISVFKAPNLHSFLVERVHYPCNSKETTFKTFKVVYNSRIEKNQLIYQDKSITVDKTEPIAANSAIEEKRALYCSKL